MNAATLQAAPGIAARLAAILLGMVPLIARAFLRHPRYAAIILPLCQRLRRTAARFAAMMDRLAAATPPRPGRNGRSSGPSPVRLPTRQGWLLAELRHEAAYFRAQLEALLSEPETTALLQAAPRAASLLRPICRMLALRHPALPPLPRRKRARATPDAAAPAAVAPPDPDAGVPVAGPQAWPEPPCPRLAHRWPWNTRPAAAPR